MTSSSGSRQNSDVHGRDLRYFVAVAEDLHFTCAAERLFVSQPALSKQIRLLERRLDVQLFHRDHRNVHLTEAGALLLPYAQQLLAEWDAATTTLTVRQIGGRTLSGLVCRAQLTACRRAVPLVAAVSPRLRWRGRRAAAPSAAARLRVEVRVSRGPSAAPQW